MTWMLVWPGRASRGFVGSLRLAEVRYANELPDMRPAAASEYAASKSSSG